MARYNRQDRFFKKAKQEKFAARSIYKLEELDRRFHLFRPQGRVVDLGCAPGSWLQYIAARVGPRGLVLGYDLAAVTVSAGPQVRIFQVDVLAMTPEQVRADAGLEPAVAEIGDRGAREAEPVSGGEALPAEGGEPTRGAREAEPAPAEGRGSKQGGFDALVSDMAPKLSGIRDADQARSIALAEKALALAGPLVREGGAFVAKVFQGRDTDAFLLQVKTLFSDVRLLKLEATREGSREAFIVARGRRGTPVHLPSGR